MPGSASRKKQSNFLQACRACLSFCPFFLPPTQVPFLMPVKIKIKSKVSRLIYHIKRSFLDNFYSYSLPKFIDWKRNWCKTTLFGHMKCQRNKNVSCTIIEVKISSVTVCIKKNIEIGCFFVFLYIVRSYNLPNQNVLSEICGQKL